MNSCQYKKGYQSLRKINFQMVFWNNFSHVHARFFSNGCGMLMSHMYALNIIICAKHFSKVGTQIIL